MLELEVSAARIPEIDPKPILVRAVFSAPPLPQGDRRPAQFALLIDRSSSMSGAPLTAAVEAAAKLVDRLDERDRLTVVAFDAYAVVLSDAAAMDGPAKESLGARLRALVPGAGTNMGAAIQTGIQTLSRVLLRGASPHILMLTDGEPSIGARNPVELIGLATSALRAGVTLSTAGVGARYDTELLSRMAEAGGGSFHHLPEPEHIASVLMREVDGVSEAAASEVALYIAPADEIDTVELLHRLPTQHKEGSLRVQVGEVCAGARRTAMMLVRGRGDSVGTVRLSYLEPSGGSQLVVPREVKVGAGGEAGRMGIAGEWLELKVAGALDRAWHYAIGQRQDQAAEVLQDVLTTAERLRRGGFDSDAVGGALTRIESTRALIARADAARADLEAARRADKSYTHNTMVSRVFKRDE